MKVHESVTSQRVVELIEEDDNVGLCIACGAERHNTEPDAKNYVCDDCRLPQVFGVETILLQFDLPEEKP